MKNQKSQKKPFVVAEIGNNHFGSLDMAMELVQAAKESGCDAVKGQLFDPKTIEGSMPKGFYRQCARLFKHNDELISYADSIGIPLFFSCFDEKCRDLVLTRPYQKISASQYRKIHEEGDIELRDNKNMFISIPADMDLPELKNAIPMHVTDYMTTFPKLERINEMRGFYRRDVGFSDHSIGIRTCIDAVVKHKAMYIEKHFTLENNMEFKGKIFRDTAHGIIPRVMKKLIRIINEE